MLTSVIKGCIKFFHTHSAGQIMNRFSKDTRTMDEVISLALTDIFQVSIRAFPSIILLLFVNYLFIVPIIFTSLLVYKIFTIYFYTATNVKHLENSTRSPVFTHLMSSLRGLTTIRVCKVEEILCKEFDMHQDIHSSAWYLSLAANSALGYWLSIVICILLSSIVFSFFIFNTGALGSSVGFSVFQIATLNGALQHSLMLIMALIINLTCVERIQEFTKLEPEESTTTEIGKKPPVDWPDKGCIEFDHVNLRYSDPGPPALNDINIKIKPMEKVGIVGRTGAGKSSLVNILYRMVNYEGRITIDSIDIQEVTLQNYRNRISIIPQEPQLFSTTVRENLDPHDILGDRLLWEALSDVEMKNSVTSLDMPLESGASSYSTGERQLLCMARAIVRNSKIIILDEATANVDPETDAIIQRTVRTKFKDCTVITIAHRLNTIMDSDRVLVMDSGSVIEFDHPYVLLRNKQSYFFKLVQQTGSSIALQMYEIAKQAYNERHTHESSI